MKEDTYIAQARTEGMRRTGRSDGRGCYMIGAQERDCGIAMREINDCMYVRTQGMNDLQ